ncbi:MAG: diadenylate cyclase CdaA [Desulfovibrio sp.]|nr:diadenylate cyclase CdaA [Desulfovibrio sp.]
MLEHIAFDWRDALDITVVAVLLYQVIQMVRGSRALTVLMGLGLLTLLYFVANAVGLYTLTWLLQHVFSSLFLLIVVIFQADIRQALGEMGARPLFHKHNVRRDSVEEMVTACVEMARLHVGALIVIERGTRLGDMIQREGVRVDARISRQLLMNIFYPKAPLHDGAVIISRDRVTAAACILPLAEAKGQNFGTRHRAALGIARESDAAVIVVSEERGEISVVFKGEFMRSLDGRRLRQVLDEIL